MKINNIFYLLFFCLTFAFVGCEDDPIVEKAEDTLFENGGATIAYSDLTAEIFDLADADLTPVTFAVSSKGETVSGVDIFIKHNDGPTNLLSNVSNLPATVSINVNEAASACGVQVSDLAVGDVFLVTFGNVATASGVFGAGARLSIGVESSEAVFKSALGGSFACVTSLTNQAAGISWDGCEGQTWEGTIEWRAEHTLPEADGVYAVYSLSSSSEFFDDASHGAYYPCYGTTSQGTLPNNGAGMGDLRLSDVDGRLSFTGASQWGETYTITSLAVNGTELTFSWTNDYGEGANVKLTRTDGVDWPANLTN